MSFEICCYVAENGKKPFLEWFNGLQKNHKSQLSQKIDMLILKGESLRPNALTGTDAPGVSKMRVNSNVQLRPLLCRKNETGCYIFLTGAVERDNVLRPAGILEKAVGYKSNLIRSGYKMKEIYEKHEK